MCIRDRAPFGGIKESGNGREGSKYGIDDYLEKIADSALDGARGNSGAIMAQFFQGFSDGSKGIKKMTTADFSRAVSTASSLSRDALSEPKEGTILTVINDFSEALEVCVDRGVSDFELLFKEALSKTQVSLENTPNLLPVLKQSGVVDAGAQGFVDLLDGIYEFVRSGSLKDINDGFIHFSTKKQLRETVTTHFAGEESLILMAIDSDVLGDWLVWEQTRNKQLFPHFYGQLNFSKALWFAPLERQGDSYMWPDGF